MDEEIWKDIPGYEGLYQASSYGRIKSLSREVRGKDSRAGAMFSKDRILKTHIKPSGHLGIHLTKNRVAVRYNVHRLIAITFLPNPDNLPVINHIDGDPGNNKIDNLEWCTQKHNIKHAREVLGNKPNNHREVVCTETGVVYYSMAEAGRLLNDPRVTSGNVQHAIKTGRRCGGYHWKYLTVR